MTGASGSEAGATSEHPSRKRRGVANLRVPFISAQDPGDYLSRDIGEAVLAPVVEIGEFFMVDAEEMEPGSVQVVNMNGLVFGSQADGSPKSGGLLFSIWDEARSAAPSPSG